MSRNISTACSGRIPSRSPIVMRTGALIDFRSSRANPLNSNAIFLTLATSVGHRVGSGADLVVGVLQRRRREVGGDAPELRGGIGLVGVLQIAVTGPINGQLGARAPGCRIATPRATVPPML